MSHKDVLLQLFPLKNLGGVHDGDATVEGASLDRVQAAIFALLAEMFPDTASVTIGDWERVCAVTPGPADPLQTRRNRVVAKLQARGGLSIAYYVAFAAALGYTIEIEEMPAGTEGAGAEGIFRWRVHVTNQPLYYFLAGQSTAGEPLLWWDTATALEGPMQAIKPAHTELLFAYS
jgi:uncharacterized protein YmfQ (DUF2313 family)